MISLINQTIGSGEIESNIMRTSIKANNRNHNLSGLKPNKLKSILKWSY